MRAPATMLLVLALVPGCDVRPTTIDECDTFILADLAVHEFAITASTPVAGRAFDLRSDAPGSHLLEIGLGLDASNRSVDDDCVVAVYVGNEEPDADALPDLPLGEAPPPSIDGLGDLVVALNVPRDWGETDTASAYVQQLTTGPDSVLLYATVATCGDASIELVLAFWGDYCLLDDADEEDPEKVGVDSFESTRIW